MQSPRHPRHCPVAPRRSHRPSSISHRPAAPRRAFTLIELLIVLAIIGILAGLLLGGVFGVFTTARATQVTAEISSLEKAIVDFKQRFGVEPPSYFVFYENGIGTVDVNNNGNMTDVVRLQSTEALVFFLGGSGVLDTMRTINERQPLGFSTNPVNPFALGGQRVGPFHEFDLSRFCDIDQDGMPEYLDPIPGQLLPYLYFSSYEGAGYRPFGLNGTPDPAGMAQVDDEILRQGSGASGTDVIQGLYLTNDGSWPMVGGRPGETLMDTQYINPKSFQIISPGQDFRFGVGGTYIRGKGLAVFSGTDTYRTTEVRQPEFDNITNFSSGLIGDTTFTKPAV
jgi:prepilin-type N-terminal cleavage/methylation domain-containing protein